MVNPILGSISSIINLDIVGLYKGDSSQSCQCDAETSLFVVNPKSIISAIGSQ
jgi:hypothetical protein